MFFQLKKIACFPDKKKMHVFGSFSTVKEPTFFKTHKKQHFDIFQK